MTQLSLRRSGKSRAAQQRLPHIRGSLQRLKGGNKPSKKRRKRLTKAPKGPSTRSARQTATG
jgi:hypothetical protein